MNCFNFKLNKKNICVKSLQKEREIVYFSKISIELLRSMHINIFLANLAHSDAATSTTTVPECFE